VRELASPRFELDYYTASCSSHRASSMGGLSLPNIELGTGARYNEQ